MFEELEQVPVNFSASQTPLCSGFSINNFFVALSRGRFSKQSQSISLFRIALYKISVYHHRVLSCFVALLLHISALSGHMIHRDLYVMCGISKGFSPTCVKLKSKCIVCENIRCVCGTVVEFQVETTLIYGQSHNIGPIMAMGCIQNQHVLLLIASSLPPCIMPLIFITFLLLFPP